MKKDLVEKGLNTDQVKQVCIDMSPAFISGVINNFPKSDITFDRFHVKKLLNEAVDKMRQQERKVTTSAENLNLITHTIRYRIHINPFLNNLLRKNI